LASQFDGAVVCVRIGTVLHPAMVFALADGACIVQNVDCPSARCPDRAGRLSFVVTIEITRLGTNLSAPPFVPGGWHRAGIRVCRGFGFPCVPPEIRFCGRIRSCVGSALTSQPCTVGGVKAPFNRARRQVGRSFALYRRRRPACCRTTRSTPKNEILRQLVRCPDQRVAASDSFHSIDIANGPPAARIERY
jgi:hypothetical protein